MTIVMCYTKNNKKHGWQIVALLRLILLSLPIFYHSCWLLTYISVKMYQMCVSKVVGEKAAQVAFSVAIYLKYIYHMHQVETHHQTSFYSHLAEMEIN